MADPGTVILLVDDDVDFVQINRLVLEAQGYTVISCYDPHEALALMAKSPPNLVITDLMMKDLDSGFDFSRKIKADPRFSGIPVIIATSVSSQLGYDFKPHTQQDLAAMGVDAYFDKPIPPAKLISRIRELLAQFKREK